MRRFRVRVYGNPGAAADERDESIRRDFVKPYASLFGSIESAIANELPIRPVRIPGKVADSGAYFNEDVFGGMIRYVHDRERDSHLVGVRDKEHSDFERVRDSVPSTEKPELVLPRAGNRVKMERPVVSVCVDVLGK